MSSYTKTRSDGCTVTGTLVDNKVNGTVTVAYPNGVIKSVEYYDMNIPIGVHEFWDDQGNLQHTITYNDEGQVIEQDGHPVDPTR